MSHILRSATDWQQLAACVFILIASAAIPVDEALETRVCGPFQMVSIPHRPREYRCEYVRGCENFNNLRGVCGTDYKYYGNECVFEKAKANYKRAGINLKVSTKFFFGGCKVTIKRNRYLGSCDHYWCTRSAGPCHIHRYKSCRGNSFDWVEAPACLRNHRDGEWASRVLDGSQYGYETLLQEFNSTSLVNRNSKLYLSQTPRDLDLPEPACGPYQVVSENRNCCDDVYHCNRYDEMGVCGADGKYYGNMCVFLAAKERFPNLYLMPLDWPGCEVTFWGRDIVSQCSEIDCPSRNCKTKRYGDGFNGVIAPYCEKVCRDYTRWNRTKTDTEESHDHEWKHHDAADSEYDPDDQCPEPTTTMQPKKT